jgi:hypothetical protein
LTIATCYLAKAHVQTSISPPRLAERPVESKAIRCLDRLDAYDVALAALERDRPVLDPDSNAFDEEIMLSVYEWMRSLVRQGADPVMALHTAAFDLLGPRRSS